MLAEKYLLKHRQSLLPTLHEQEVSLAWLQRLSKVDRLVVTYSELFYTGEIVLNQCFTMLDQKEATRGEMLFLAGSLVGNHSTKPLFLALRRSAEQIGIPLREVDVDSLPGGGLEGKLDRNRYSLGSLESMQAEGIQVGVTVRTLTQQLEVDGLLPLYLAQRSPNRLLAVFAFLAKTDTQVVETIAQLHQQGIDTSVITQVSPEVRAPLLRLQVSYVPGEKEGLQQSLLQVAQDSPQALFCCNAETSRSLPSEIMRFSVGSKPVQGSVLHLKKIGELPGAMAEVLTCMQVLRRRFFWSRL